jgi:branched-chain amino acid transport system substrate-binding protein
VRTLFTLCIAALCAVLLLACGDDGDDTGTTTAGGDWEGETITLGSIYSTTGIGEPFGPQQVQGAELAIEEINEDGGINGAEVSLEQIDDRSEPADAKKAAQKLIDGEALAILGPTFSNSSLEAHPLADEEGIAMLATSNTAPGIVGDDCEYPCENVFRDSLGEETAIPANVESYVAEADAQTALVIYPADDPFGEVTAGIASDALEANDIKVVDKLRLPASPPTGQFALVRRLVLRGDKPRPDVIFITASSGEAAAGLIEAARDISFDGDILGGNAFNSPVVSDAAGPDGEGAQSASAWFADSDDAENADFVAAYQEAYGEPAGQFSAQAYTGVQLLAEAARNSDLSFDELATDRSALIDALSDVNIPTPLGDFSFTEDHDVSQPIWIVEMDGEGGFELIEQVDPAE